MFEDDGIRIDEGGVSPQTSTSISVALPGNLDDGAFVAYRVTSVDAHPIAGTRTFTVGDAATLGAIMGAVTLSGPITRAWHPPVEFLPLVDDAEIEIVSPTDGATLDDEFEVTTAVAGGGFGPTAAAPEEPSPDPEEAGQLIVAVDGDTTTVESATACSMIDPCSEATFPLALRPGEHTVSVELRTADGAPFAQPVVDRSTNTVR